jgi:hypothetical protein
MRRVAVFLACFVLFAVALSAGKPDVDTITWENPAIWKCANSLSIKRFPVTGKFKGELPKEDYIKMFAEDLAAGLRSKGIFERVDVLEEGKTPTTDLVFEGELTTLTTGSRGARFWIGCGAGKSKCEVSLRCRRVSDQAMVFSVEHARISTEGLKSDEVQENIEEVVEDLVGVLSAQKPGCNDPNVITGTSGAGQSKG